MTETKKGVAVDAKEKTAKVKAPKANGSKKDAPVIETNVVEETTSAAPLKKAKKKEDILPAAGTYPAHFVEIALIIKNNAEIRRFTALGILNYLLQKGEIKGDNRYVSFKWTKFAVRCNGLTREYSYTEPFFLNCLVASFASFSASAQKTIDTFTRKEMSVGIAKAVDQGEVDDITNMNAIHTGDATEIAE